jgi:hypothetical protein
MTHDVGPLASYVHDGASVTRNGQVVAGSSTGVSVDPSTITADSAESAVADEVRLSFRTGAGCAVLGALFLLVGTAMHPVPANLNDAALSFADYAATSRPAWVAAHLIQLAGVTGMVLAMVVLARAAGIAGRSRFWARVTAVYGAAAIAVTAALQAVDGVALKAAVDLWAQAPAAERSALFAAAQALRQTEIGLDGMFSLTLGATTLAFGLILAAARARLLAALALLTAATAAVAGVLFCLQGFSATAMNAGTASGVLGLVLTTATAAWGWRRAPRTAPKPSRA